MFIGKVSLKEWILRTEFWANADMTNTVMKFPPYIEKDISKIIKIDKPYEKGMYRHKPFSTQQHCPGVSIFQASSLRIWRNFLVSQKKGT